MRLKSPLLCRTIVWLAIPVLLAQGCVTSNPPSLKNTPPGTIGVVSASVIPEMDAPKTTSKAEAGTQGAIKGLGMGLLGALICPFGLVGAPFGGAPLLVGCLVAAGTPALMVVGAVGGTEAWIPQEIEAQGKTLLSDTLNQGQMQDLLKEQVIKATQVKVSQQVVSLEEGVAEVTEERINYSHLASRGIDTVFEVSLVGIGFVKGKPEDDETTTEKIDESKEDQYGERLFSLTMAAHVRAIRIKDNESLSEVTKNFTSEPRKWSDWVVRQDCSTNEHCVVRAGQAFDEAIEEGHNTLANQIVDEIWQLPESPMAVRAAELRPIVYDGYAEIALSETESVRKDYERAWLSFERKDYQAAVSRFSGFVKKKPKSRLAAAAQFWLGESYFALKEFEKAIVAYDEVRRYPQTDKVAAALLRQGLAFSELGQRRNARFVWQELVEKFPQSAEAPWAKLYKSTHHLTGD